MESALTACEWKPTVAASTTGVSVSRRRLIAVAEITLAQQSLAEHTSPFHDGILAQRQTNVSVMVGYTSPPARRLSFNLIGGTSYSQSNVDGLIRIKQAFGSVAGRHLFNDQPSRTGLVGGTDLFLNIAKRLDIVVPVRVTLWTGTEPLSTPGLLRAAGWPVSETLTGPGSSSVTAGVGLRYRLYQRVN